MSIKCCQKRLQFPERLVMAVPGRLTSVEYVQPTDKMNPILDLSACDILRKITISPDINLMPPKRETDSCRKRSRSFNESSILLVHGFVPRRKASVTDFEAILKDMKEDMCTSDQGYCSRSSSLSPPSTGDDQFYDISLEEEVVDEPTAESLLERNRLIRLFDELLADIYSIKENTSADRRWSELNIHSSGDQRKKYVRYQSVSVDALRKKLNFPAFSEFQEAFFADTKNTNKDNLTLEELMCKNKHDLMELKDCLQASVELTGQQLVVELEEKDTLITEQQDACAFITASIQAYSHKRSEDTHVKFSVSPLPGDSGFEEWATAMKMVARLPDGIPSHFRKTLWLTLAEKHLTSRGVNWPQTERTLFNDSSNPDDHELSVQIVKDLHRTGCSLFCGVSGQHNQAVLKRVLLAYARWNKSVGYCQGLNMLAALILQVMQGSQSATVKVMIYLIEGVLPESYFANNLRGLSVDMAVFRDLLRLKLPELSKHLDHLQHDSKDPGTNYEPPLMDVFTMQWFLTIFSNCLPQSTVLRVWDLIFLEGNHVLLKTALAIWQTLSERMMVVRSADEFYSIMAVLTREMLEFGLMEPNNLIKAIDTLMIPEVNELREKYVYNITPWTVSTVAKKGLKLFYSDPYDSDEDHITSYQSSSIESHKYTPYSNHPDREKIALDISVLKRQYSRLRERQRQAHIILSAACSSESLTASNSPTLNHLLLGKSALLNQVKGRRIQGAVPTPPGSSSHGKQRSSKQVISGETLHWRDAEERKLRRKSRSQEDEDLVSERSPSLSSSSSSSTELCDDSSDTDDGLSLDEERGAQGVKEEGTVEEDGPQGPLENQEPKGTEDGEELKKSEDNDTRRNSELALLQILQENSEILQRIQSHSSISVISESPEREGLSSTDSEEPQEPKDITEIRKKYDRLRQMSLEVAPSPKPTLDKAFSSFDSSSKGTNYPFPKSPRRNREVGIKLGLYSPE